MASAWRLEIRGRGPIIAQAISQRFYHGSMMVESPGKDGQSSPESLSDPVRPSYKAPIHPIVLCHGLFGFDSIKSPVPLIVKDISYWYGIKEALEAHGAKVISASVSPAGAIETRAKMLQSAIEEKLGPETEKVNLIGHSMGGLDARYMISVLNPQSFHAVSLTTVATPHRGSSLADNLFDTMPDFPLRTMFKILEVVAGITDAAGIQQLTRKYMTEEFNPKVVDDPQVTYMSYGATFKPRLTSVLGPSGRLIQKEEGDNDGLCSIESAKWGAYMGTLEDCDHLEVINLRTSIRGKKHFDAVGLYLSIMNDLAERGF
jgi:triacylglycerol lipase